MTHRILPLVSLLFLFLFPCVGMGYDLHITKAAEWSESTLIPITEEQWMAFIAEDGELGMDTTATAGNPRTGEVVQISDPLMASWIDPKTGEKHYFYYSRGKVSVKNPSEGAIKKMKAVASKLGAKVQGDDGEPY